MSFLMGFLIGIGIGIVVIPIITFILIKIKNTNERRNIKKMIMKGEFLKPIDKVDIDTSAWSEHLNLNEMKNDYDTLAIKIFKNKKGED